MASTLLPPTEKIGTGADRPKPIAGGPKRSRERLLSLDVFRGLTVAGMLLVNDPGTWSAIHPPLEHAQDDVIVSLPKAIDFSKLLLGKPLRG